MSVCINIEVVCVCVLCVDGCGRRALVHPSTSITVRQSNRSNPSEQDILNNPGCIFQGQPSSSHTRTHTRAHTEIKSSFSTPTYPRSPSQSNPLTTQPIVAPSLLSHCLLQQKHHAHILPPRSSNRSVSQTPMSPELLTPPTV